MIATGSGQMVLGDWWPSLVPGVAISLTVFGFAAVGHALERRYGAAPPAVAGLDLDLHAEEVVGLTGASGSGKSTAAYALLGHTRPPGRITGGEVRLDGTDLLSLPASARRALRGRRIGLIVQNPRTSLHPLINVGTRAARCIPCRRWATRSARCGRRTARGGTAPPRPGAASGRWCS